VACVEAEECSATFVQTMRAKVQRHFWMASGLPLCERTFRSMHRYGDLSALAAALSRRTLTRRHMALSLERLPSKASTSPDIQKNVRVALDWMLDLFFAKDIVQLPPLRSPNVSEAEEAPTPAIEGPPAGAAKSRS